MVKVKRLDPYGYVGYKSFNTKEEALEWLNSADVKQDEEDGFSFSLIEDSEKDGG